MSKIEALGDIGGSVEEGDYIATALFIMWMFFMLGWLVDPGVSPLPSQFGATASNFNVVSAFFPLLVVIIPMTIFGILKNMFQGQETIRREAFSISPKFIMGVQTKIAGFSTRTQAKRQFYKKYGRGSRYHQVQKKEPEEDISN